MDHMHHVRFRRVNHSGQGSARCRCVRVEHGRWHLPSLTDALRPFAIRTFGDGNARRAASMKKHRCSLHRCQHVRAWRAGMVAHCLPSNTCDRRSGHVAVASGAIITGELSRSRMTVRLFSRSTVTLSLHRAGEIFLAAFPRGLSAGVAISCTCVVATRR